MIDFIKKNKIVLILLLLLLFFSRNYYNKGFAFDEILSEPKFKKVFIRSSVNNEEFVVSDKDDLENLEGQLRQLHVKKGDPHIFKKPSKKILEIQIDAKDNESVYMYFINDDKFIFVDEYRKSRSYILLDNLDLEKIMKYKK